MNENDQNIPKNNYRKENIFDKLLRYIVNFLIILFLISMIFSINRSMYTENPFRVLLDKKIPHPDKVPGLYNEKKELFRYTKLYKNYKLYDTFDIRIPKGILLTGKPGTGKTYLTKCIAAHENINIIVVNGADFSFPLVGQGKMYLQQLIQKAQANAPCIIVIDEIDAMGGNREETRGGGGGSAATEKQSVVMLLCTYMDGINYIPGVFFIAATNRPDMLDKALLRKGRFDVHIDFTLPNKEERMEIIMFYIDRKLPLIKKKKKIAEYFLTNTIGYTGAETESIINETAILLLENTSSDPPNLKNIIFASKLNGELGFIKSLNQNENDIQRTLYHEVGHAIMMRLMAILGYHTNPLYISTEPRTKSLGVTVANVNESKHSTTFNDLVASVMVRVAGHCTEKYNPNDMKIVKDGNYTLGAMSDFEGITNLVRLYIQSGIDVSSGMIYTQGKELTNKEINRINEFIKIIYEKTHLLLQNKKIKKLFLKFIKILNSQKRKEFFFNDETLEQFVPSNFGKELNIFWRNEILIPNLMCF